jgi:hypothetical protein
MNTAEDSYIDIGDNHSIHFTEYKGDKHAGMNVKHLTPEGKECNGFISFTGGAWAKEFEGHPTHQSWEAQSFEPLTMTPSILCRVCGDHGFITNDKWVKA